MVLVTVGTHPFDHGLDDLTHHTSTHRIIGERTRCECAHPAGIRSAIAVEDALVILCRTERNSHAPVAQRKERHLGARQTLFEDDSSASVAELSIFHRRAHRLTRLFASRCDDDPLTGGQTIGFHDDRQAELAELEHGVGLGRRLTGAKARRRNAVTRHERFRKRLAAL